MRSVAGVYLSTSVLTGSAANILNLPLWAGDRRLSANTVMSWHLSDLLGMGANFHLTPQAVRLRRMPVHSCGSK